MMMTMESHNKEILVRVPDVAVEWVAILLHIREAPVSTPGSETGYSEYVHNYSQSVREIVQHIKN
jgi:hypothetical protein